MYIPDNNFKLSLSVKHMTKTYIVTAKTNNARTKALEMQPINNLQEKKTRTNYVDNCDLSRKNVH